MTIEFNGIPSNLRVPFVYVEFDNSRAVQGPSSQPFKNLIMGQRLTTGTVAALTPVLVTSVDQAKTFFGAGSMLHEMLGSLFKANQITETWAIALDDNASGVKSAGSISITGPATANGTLNLYIGGVLVPVGVSSGDAATAIATAVAAAIAANTSLPITAAVDGTNAFQVNITYRHKGIVGNFLDIRLNYQDGDVFPVGVAATVVPMSAGTLNPDISAALAVLGDAQYNCIATPYNDAANLTALETELDSRFGPLKQNDGHAFGASNVSYSSVATLGNGRNSPHLSILGVTGSPTPPWRWAAALCGIASYNLSIDPARPLQTLAVPGVLPPLPVDRKNLSERNIWLFDGISTFNVDSGGVCRLERIITTYKTNPAGGADISYLDVETMFTLSYLRYDWRNYVLSKYPRHKLADDGVRVAPGQAIVTPKLMKAEAIAKFVQWGELGLVEGVDQFKADLIVERNVSDPNRLDIMLPPNLVNQFRVMGAQIGFLL